MQLTQQNFILILVGFFVFEILIAILILWHEIMSFFMPHKYSWFAVKLNNGHLFEKLVKRGKKDENRFKDFDYKLYYPPTSTAKPIHKGAVTYFMFNQNEEFPLDFSTLKVTDDENFHEDLKKQEFNELWVEEFSLGDFFSKNLIPILAILGLIIIIIVLIAKGEAPPVVVQPGG